MADRTIDMSRYKVVKKAKLVRLADMVVLVVA